MTTDIPNWLLLLAGGTFFIWIIAGIAVYKAANAFRAKYGDYMWTPHGPTGGNPLPPAHNPYDDADWWKRQG